MHELLQYLNRKGATTFLTVAQHGLVGDMKSPVDVTYLADTVVLLRYFEALGRVRRAISVVKKRTGAHEDTIREYQIGPRGVTLGRSAVAVPGRAARRARSGRGQPICWIARTLEAHDALRARAGPRAASAATPRSLPACSRKRDSKLVVCESISALVAELDVGAGFVVVTEEALATADLHALVRVDRRPGGMVGLPVRTADPPRRRAGAQPGRGKASRAARQRHFPRAAVPPDHADQPGPGRAARAQAAVRGARATGGLARERTALPHAVRHDGRGFLPSRCPVRPAPRQNRLAHRRSQPGFRAPHGPGRRARSLAAQLRAGPRGGLVRDYGRIARTGLAERFDHDRAALGRCFDVYAFAVDQPGEPQVAVLFHDISDRKAAEERLRQLNETLEALVAERSAELDRTWQAQPGPARHRRRERVLLSHQSIVATRAGLDGRGDRGDAFHRSHPSRRSRAAPARRSEGWPPTSPRSCSRTATVARMARIAGFLGRRRRKGAAITAPGVTSPRRRRRRPRWPAHRKRYGKARRWRRWAS